MHRSAILLTVILTLLTLLTITKPLQAKEAGVVTFSLAGTPNGGNTPLMVTLKSSCASSGSTIKAWTWDCGNGTLPPLPWGATVQCAYAASGPYYPMVAAVDGAGNGAGVSVEVGVCGAPNYCSSTSTANPGPIVPLFNGTLGVNQTAYDTTYNPTMDCYTRA